MQMPLLVKSSITINGTKFTTLIRDGASAEELISKVAKENGGGVARVYYPELKTHEIVAVKIGEQLIVKGDPKRVQDGDFSEFEDAASVKNAAVTASSSSKGGIHFFVGSDGIPMAAAENEGIVFPNAQELRVNTNINNLSLAVVDYNVDPKNIREINKLYKKGARISRDAKEEIEKSHGGVRSEKLMLPDTSVLILSRESGDIRTASEFASNFKAAGFFQPAAPQQFFVPQQVHRGLQLPTDLGVMHIPLDGSSSKIPYLCVKVFDGKVTDAIKVTTYLPENETPKRRRKRPEPAPEPKRIPAPEFIGKTEICELKPKAQITIPNPKTEAIMSFFNTPMPALQKLKKVKNPEPKQVKTEKLPEPAQAASKPRKRKPPTQKTVQKTAKRKTVKAKAPKLTSRKPKTARKSGKVLSKAKQKPRKTPKKLKSKKPAKPKAKRPRPKTPPKSRKTPKPKPEKKKKAKVSVKPAKKAKRRKKPINVELVKISTNWTAKPSKKMSKKKKKKIQAYHLHTMLGLIKSKRNGARNSKGRKAASRT